MNVFVDTSALFATLDYDSQDHALAVQVWRDLAEQRADVVSTNYVILETVALSQNRLGMGAIRLLEDDVTPLVHIHWLGAMEHQAAMRVLLTANRRQLSLVDCTSFDAMRRLGIRTAFAFDEHFAEQGFACMP
jgi:predicted nucleic acid-binding protein